MTSKHLKAATKLYGPSRSVTPKSETARFPTLDEEAWLANRLGDRTLFAGTTTPETRRERMRQRIIGDGRQEDVAGRRNGVEETYGALFERLYGEAL